MLGYVKALRLPVCILGGLLVVVGYRLAGLGLSGAILPLVYTVVVASATMVWNDWRDRFHDVRKGRTFALQAGNKFLVFALSLWAVCLAFATLLLVGNLYQGILAFATLAAGLIYSETRMLLFVPNTMVALVSASPVLYATPVTYNATMIFLATACAIYAREIIKDMEDIGADEGYKRTLIQLAGERVACVVVSGFLALSAILLLHLKLAGANTVLISGQVGENAIALLALTLALQLEPRVIAPLFKTILDVWVAYYLLVIAISGVP